MIFLEEKFKWHLYYGGGGTLDYKKCSTY